MKFDTKSFLQLQKTQDEQTLAPQEMSFVSNQNENSVFNLMSRMRAFINTLDPDQGQRYVIQMSVDTLTHSIHFQLIRKQPIKNNFSLQKHIPYLNNAIATYQKIQFVTVQTCKKTIKKVNRTKKFIESYRSVVQEHYLSRQLYRQLSSMINESQMPVINNHTFSQTKNDGKQDAVQKFKIKFGNQGTVFYQSCLFEVD